MKFLRLAFYVLIAQLVLSGCAGEAVEETSSSSSSEINFDAYLGRNASTRSEVTDNTHLKGTEGNSGFGVFARYKHTDGTISPLMLMNNERVTWNKDQNHWEYTNTRYWPSEGSVDFYAFAPYSDQPKLVSPPNKNEANPTCIFFPSNVSPVDLVWANAKDQTKTEEPVKFTFKHALARLGFDITANQILEKNGAVIKVKEVKLYGADEISGVFVMAGYLNLENGAWTLADNGISWFYTWTPDGTVDGKKFDNSIIYKLSAPPQLDHEHDKVTNHDDSYIFIIPQKKPDYFNLKITYTVVQGNFKEDVTVTKNLLEVPGVSDPSFTFEGGKAYVFHLKLSLDPINFNVTTKVEDWKEGKNE
ncbi:fimbrillin family protein [Segatella copri]|uniref:fimbrillin family protein n=1 Tax=Segatella copri TaxID=165179 RepID=UPI003F71FB0E